MKILVLGSGGREHALCHTFVRQGHQVWCLPGNGGTHAITEPLPAKWKNQDENDYPKLADLVEDLRIDLTVVGPEAHLAKGIVDVFQSRGLSIFGPTREASQLESSKSWSKEFMLKHQIPTADCAICSTTKDARQAAKKMCDQSGGVVIKPSGLTAGKGVVCCESLKVAENAIETIIDHKRFGEAGNKVIVEEYLQGKEISILAWCDGNIMIPMIPSQDHKRLHNQNKGPNTGGVGAYSPAPFVDEKTMEQISKEIIEKTNDALKKEGILYQGVLYFGIMLTEQGPKVLEYNCRFGDPEAQTVLPLIESDLAEVMMSCAKGELEKQNIRWKPQVSCCVVMCSGGYPGGYHTGYAIEGLDSIKDESLVCFHAGTRESEEGVVTSGGRVLGVTGIGDTLEEAVKKAYSGVELIHFKDVHYRTDIAHQAFD